MGCNSRVFKFSASFAALGMVMSSTAYAAPARVSAIDPLVSVSAFGTASSRAAVCAAGAQAAANAAVAGAAAATTAAAQPGAAPGCVLPVVDVVPAPVVAVPPVVPVATTGGIGTLPLLLGLVALAGLAAALLGDGDDAEGDLSPVSP